MGWNPSDANLHAAPNRTVGETCNIENCPHVEKKIIRVPCQNLGTIDKSPTVTKALSSLVICIPMDLGWVKAKILKIDTHVIKTADKKWRIMARCQNARMVQSHLTNINALPLLQYSLNCPRGILPKLETMNWSNLISLKQKILGLGLIVGHLPTCEFPGSHPYCTLHSAHAAARSPRCPQR